MRVVQVSRFGGPEVLELVEAPDPVAGRGQVVVEVAAVPVLFLDTQVRRGRASWLPVAPPFVPGAGVGGTVRAVGDGVDPSWTGRRVVADTDGVGAYAERAAVAEDALVAVPDGLDLGEAAAMLHDGRTAESLLDTVGVRPGEWVLVLGAGGGLGCLLVQLATRAGAQVVGAAGDKRKLDLAVELGAVATVDYSGAHWAEAVRGVTGGAGPDVVFDGVGGAIGQAAFELTAQGGRFSAHGAPSGGFADIDSVRAKARGITVSGIEAVQFDRAAARQWTARALDEAVVGTLHPVIGQTFPLARAAEAHAAIEARDAIGKTLLLP